MYTVRMKYLERAPRMSFRLPIITTRPPESASSLTRWITYRLSYTGNCLPGGWLTCRSIYGVQESRLLGQKRVPYNLAVGKKLFSLVLIRRCVREEQDLGWRHRSRSSVSGMVLHVKLVKKPKLEIYVLVSSTENLDNMLSHSGYRRTNSPSAYIYSVISSNGNP